MKTIIISALLLISFNCFAGYSVRVAWDKNPEDNIYYYTVYVGKESGVYQVSKNTPYVSEENHPAELQINDLEFGTKYYFVATATNDVGLESDYSNEISYFRGGGETSQIVTINNVNFLQNTVPLSNDVPAYLEVSENVEGPYIQDPEIVYMRNETSISALIPLDRPKLFTRWVFEISFDDGTPNE